MAQMPMPDNQSLRDIFQNSLDPTTTNYDKLYDFRVDKDKSGRITASELQQALKNGKWAPFNLETVKLMIRMFDKDHSGNISFNEFGSLWQYITDWQNCFRTYDRDNSNSIDKGELSTALNKFGYDFEPGTIRTILAQFVRPGRASILLDDFIRCCVQLKTLKEAFDNRDINEDGLLTIHFEQFVQMVYSINI